MGPKGSFECIRHSTSRSSRDGATFNPSGLISNSQNSRFSKNDSSLRDEGERKSNGMTSGGRNILDSSDEDEDDADNDWLRSDSDDSDGDIRKCDLMPSIDDDHMMDILGSMDYKMTISATEDSFRQTKIKMSTVLEESKKNMTKVINSSGPKVGRKVKSIGTLFAGRKNAGLVPITSGKNHLALNGHGPRSNSASPINFNHNGIAKRNNFNSSKSGGSSSGGSSSGGSSSGVSSSGGSSSTLSNSSTSNGNKLMNGQKNGSSSNSIHSGSKANGNNSPRNNGGNKRPIGTNCDSLPDYPMIEMLNEVSSKKVRHSLIPSSKLTPNSNSTFALTPTSSPSMPLLISPDPSPPLAASNYSVPPPNSLLPNSLLTNSPTVPNTRNFPQNRTASSQQIPLSNHSSSSSRHNHSSSHAPKDTFSSSLKSNGNKNNNSIINGSSISNSSVTNNSNSLAISSALITKGYSDLIDGWANKPTSPAVTVTDTNGVTAASSNGHSSHSHSHSSFQGVSNGYSQNTSTTPSSSLNGSSYGHAWSNGCAKVANGHSATNGYNIKSPPSVGSIGSNSSSSQLSSAPSSVPSPEDPITSELITPTSKGDKSSYKTYIGNKDTIPSRITSLDERNRLKASFHLMLPEYRTLQSVMDSITLRFTRMENELRNQPEGSRDWNRIMELILKEYDELKKDEKYKIQKKKHEELHRKLSELKKLIQDYDRCTHSSTTKVTVNEYKRMQKEAGTVNGHSNPHSNGSCSVVNGSRSVVNGSRSVVNGSRSVMNGCEKSGGNFNDWSEGGLVTMNGTNVLDEDDASDSDGGHFLSDEDDDNGLSFGSNTNGVMIRNS